MGFRPSNNPSEHSYDNSANRSMYQNLQAKIDKSRMQNIVTQTPKPRKLNTSKFISEPSKTNDNFTDITKIRPRQELEPIQVKKKINFAPNQNIPIKSEKEKQLLMTNTNAYLYSKIPGPNSKPKPNKTIIVSDAPDIDNYGIKSAKVSTNNKSIVSSLIATLGHRKREPKSMNVHPFGKPKEGKFYHDKRLDESPKIITESVSL